jgi:hypothetical protein
MCIVLPAAVPHQSSLLLLLQQQLMKNLSAAAGEAAGAPLDSLPTRED